MIYDLLSAGNADISVKKMRNSNSKSDFLHYQYSYDIKCELLAKFAGRYLCFCIKYAFISSCQEEIDYDFQKASYCACAIKIPIISQFPTPTGSNQKKNLKKLQNNQSRTNKAFEMLLLNYLLKPMKKKKEYT